MGSMQRTEACTEEGIEGSRLKGLAQRAHLRVRLLPTWGRRVYVCFTCSLHATAYTPPPWKHSPLQLHSVSASLQRPTTNDAPVATSTSQDPLFRSRPVLSVMCMHTIVVWLPVLPPVPPSALTEGRPTQAPSQGALSCKQRGAGSWHGMAQRKCVARDGRCRGASSFTPCTSHRMLSAAHPADRRSCGRVRRAC